MISNALPAFRRIDRTQALGKRFEIPRAAQGECRVSSQKRFDGAAQPGPSEFNLSRNGPFRDFACEPGIENQSVRKLNRLTHGPKVAKRDLVVKRPNFPLKVVAIPSAALGAAGL